jgi:hypothetical protein
MDPQIVVSHRRCAAADVAACGALRVAAPRRSVVRPLAALATGLVALLAGDPAARAAARGGARKGHKPPKVQLRSGPETVVGFNAAFGATVDCTADERAIGGGAELVGGNFSNCYIAESFPATATQWHVTVACAGGPGGSPSGTRYIPTVVCLAAV